jgi:hypothetical protein
MTVELEEFEPGRWRVKRPDRPSKRSELPVPFVISDTMDPIEQVDGKFYTSKRAFRAVGRANGLVEVGNEKLTRKRVHTSSTRAAAEARRTSIKKALDQFKAGAVRTPRP